MSMPSEPVFEPGTPMPSGYAPLCVPQIAGNEWTHIKERLDTDCVSSVGPFVGHFESDLAVRVGTRYAVATASGTAALHTALLVAGVEPNDKVLVSALTFIAPVNAIRYVGAWPVSLDGAPDYWRARPTREVDRLPGRVTGDRLEMQRVAGVIGNARLGRGHGKTGNARHGGKLTARACLAATRIR